MKLKKQQYFAKIGEKGQMTLPSAVRKNLELEPGKLVAFEVSNEGKIEVKKVDLKVKESN